MAHVRKRLTLGVVLMALVGCAGEGTRATSTVTEVDGDPRLYVSDSYEAGTRVVIDEVTLPTVDGFVVLHEDDKGQPGAVRGHVRAVKGTSTDLVLTPDEELQPGRYWAMLHMDSGTPGDFDEEDAAIMSGEDVVMQQFAIKQPTSTSLQVGFLLHGQVQTLDFAGPFEVMTDWSFMTDEFDVSLTTIGSGTSTLGLDATIETETPVEDVDGLDVLFVPGGNIDEPSRDPAVRELLERAADSGTLIAGVCNGGVILGRHGLLKGKPATTFSGSLGELRAAGAQVRADARYVDAGSVATSGAISTGIDLALHIVSRLDSVEMARDIADYMAYTPDPVL